MAELVRKESIEDSVADLSLFRQDVRNLVYHRMTRMQTVKMD